MLHVVDHPLAQHLLSALRDSSTPPEDFRRLAKVVTRILVLEATRDVVTREVEIVTPVALARGRVLTGALAAVPVLRAGLGMLDSVVEMFPEVAVGYIGLERHEETAIARSYYSKLPDLGGLVTLCLDPMLATGGSASQAISLIKSHGALKAKMVSIIAAQEGVDTLQRNHPDVEIYTVGLDERLNDRKFIVPGLGDFGDRLYGTF